MHEQTRHMSAFPEMPARDSRAAQVLSFAARLSVIGLFIIVLITGLKSAYFVLAPICLGVTAALVLGPVATRLERGGMPAPLSAGLMTVLVLIGLAAFVSGIVLPINDWIDRSPDIWQRLERLSWSLQARWREIESAAVDLSQAMGADAPSGGQAIDPLSSILPALRLAPALVGQFVIFFGTVYFFIATRHQIRDFVLSFCLSRRARWRVARIFRDIEAGFSHYFGTIAAINVVFGCAVGLLAWSFGMPTPYVWGGLAAGLNFVPYIGPALMAAILFSIGLVVFDNIETAVFLTAGFVMLNLLEGQFVTPSVVGRTLLLNPFLVFCTLTFCLWLWGAPGAFLSVPFLLSGKVVLYHLRPGRAVGRGRRLAPHRPAKL